MHDDTKHKHIIESIPDMLKFNKHANNTGIEGEASIGVW